MLVLVLVLVPVLVLVLVLCWKGVPPSPISLNKNKKLMTNNVKLTLGTLKFTPKIARRRPKAPEGSP